MNILGDWKWHAALAVFALFTALVVWMPSRDGKLPRLPGPEENDESFMREVQAELDRAADAGELFGSPSNGVAGFGIQTVDSLLAKDDEMILVASEVVESTNPAIFAGDWIIRCNGQLLRPGRGLPIIMKQQPSDTGEYSLTVLRNGSEQEIIAVAHPESYSEAQIRERQTQDAMEAVWLNRWAATQTLPDAWTSSQQTDAMLQYTVQEGDTVAGIANLFVVPEEKIRWVNQLPEGGEFSPGDKIVVPAP